jgi:hypothetical protein
MSKDSSPKLDALRAAREANYEQAEKASAISKKKPAPKKKEPTDGSTVVSAPYESFDALNPISGGRNKG